MIIVIYHLLIFVIVVAYYYFFGILFLYHFFKETRARFNLQDTSHPVLLYCCPSDMFFLFCSILLGHSLGCKGPSCPCVENLVDFLVKIKG